jgi:hypothetical protein
VGQNEVAEGAKDSRIEGTGAAAARAVAAALDLNEGDAVVANVAAADVEELFCRCDFL